MAQSGQDGTRPPARKPGPGRGPCPVSPHPILPMLPAPPQCLISCGPSVPGPRPHGPTHSRVGSDLESFTKPLPALCDVLPPDAPALLLPVWPPPDSLSPRRAVDGAGDSPAEPTGQAGRYLVQTPTLLSRPHPALAQVALEQMWQLQTGKSHLVSSKIQGLGWHQRMKKSSGPWQPTLPPLGSPQPAQLGSPPRSLPCTACPTSSSTHGSFICTIVMCRTGLRRRREPDGPGHLRLQRVCWSFFYFPIDCVILGQLLQLPESEIMTTLNCVGSREDHVGRCKNGPERAQFLVQDQ